MEEDAGKSIHDQDLYDSLIDLNRCGVGLIEIVSAPDLRSAEEAAIYLAEIRKLVRYLDVCDGNMEEGSLRCDANISIMPINSSEFGQRVEVKNINSISNVARAINYEIERQTAIVASGGTITQETRSWDSATGKTVSLREKEGADDYRYFPEPDLLPVVINQQLLNDIAAELPELPEALFKKYTQVFGLPEHDAVLLTEQKEFARYYEQTLKFLPNYKLVSNWLNGPVKSYLNEYIIDIDQFPIVPEKLAEIIRLVEQRKVSNNAAKEILFPALLANPRADVLVLAQSLEILLVEDTQAIQAAIQEIIDQNREKVQAYLGGKTGLLGFLVGQVMKQLGQGKADPKTVNTLLTQVLEAQRSTN
jgi:aspartyl-tRNA(Asn)/glutamyl-tRNA(Gln) amidotransferase subunit B